MADSPGPSNCWTCRTPERDILDEWPDDARDNRDPAVAPDPDPVGDRGGRLWRLRVGTDRAAPPHGCGPADVLCYNIGQTAAELLIARIEHQAADGPQRVVLPPGW